MKPKKKTRKKRGHRQEITRLMINSISLNGSVLTSEEAPAQSQAATSTTVAEEPTVESTEEVAAEVASEVVEAGE